MAAGTAVATPPEPSSGWANVDGNPTEWDTTNDFFSNMIRAGGNGGQTKVESKLSLRYNCGAQVMYALVLAEPGITIPADRPDDNFVKIGGIKMVDGSTGDDGTAPDFAYVGVSSGQAAGWEASFPLPPGSYTINVHAQVEDGGSQTSAVPDRAIDLVVECGEESQPEPLQVTKTANTTYARRFDWTVTKQAAPASITTPANTATFSYTVTVTKSAPIDTGFTVSGQITIANPNSFAVSGVTIADAIDGGPTCSVQGGSNLPIPGNGSVSVPYTCLVTSAAGGLNVATATWSSGVSAGEAPFTFGAPASVSHDTVDVKDAFNGGTPTILAGGGNLNHSAVFTYTRGVDVPASGCLNFPNVATVVSPQQLFREASAKVEACRATAGIVGAATPAASLRVTKRGPKIATAGTVVTFTIVVRNTSASSAATSVVLRDILPAGYSVVRRPSGAAFQKGRLVWNVGTLPAGAAKTVRVQIRLDRSTAGTRCNTAVASAGNAPTVRARVCTKVLRVLGASRLPIVTG
jgi:uncharacterized repeat protein (TIGR01451 family)